MPMVTQHPLADFPPRFQEMWRVVVEECYDLARTAGVTKAYTEVLKEHNEAKQRRDTKVAESLQTRLYTCKLQLATKSALMH